MNVISTSIGRFASPFYPLVPAFRGEVRAADVRLMIEHRWLSILLSLSLVAVAIGVLWAGEYEIVLAVAFVAEHATRRKLFPVTTLDEREIVGLEWDPRFAWDHVLNLAAIGFAIGVVGWLGGGVLAAVAGVLVVGCIVVSAVPFANRRRGQGTAPS